MDFWATECWDTPEMQANAISNAMSGFSNTIVSTGGWQASDEDPVVVEGRPWTAPLKLKSGGKIPSWWLDAHTPIEDATFDAVGLLLPELKMAGALAKFAKLTKCGGCFVEGTLVDTPTGPRRIEDIEVGDEVLAWDPASGTVSTQHVTALIRPDPPWRRSHRVVAQTHWQNRTDLQPHRRRIAHLPRWRGSGGGAQCAAVPTSEREVC